MAAELKLKRIAREGTILSAFNSAAAPGGKTSTEGGGKMKAPGSCPLDRFVRGKLTSSLPCDRAGLTPGHAIPAEPAPAAMPDQADVPATLRSSAIPDQRAKHRAELFHFSSKKSSLRNSALIKPTAAVNDSTVVTDSNQIQQPIFNLPEHNLDERSTFGQPTTRRTKQIDKAHRSAPRYRFRIEPARCQVRGALLLTRWGQWDDGRTTAFHLTRAWTFAGSVRDRRMCVRCGNSP